MSAIKFPWWWWLIPFRKRLLSRIAATIWEMTVDEFCDQFYMSQLTLPDDNLSTDDVAKMLGMSRSHVIRIASELMGWQNNRRGKYHFSSRAIWHYLEAHRIKPKVVETDDLSFETDKDLGRLAEDQGVGPCDVIKITGKGPNPLSDKDLANLRKEQPDELS